MPLDPRARALLDQIAASGMPLLHEMSVSAAREMLNGMLAMQGEPPAVARVEDRRLPGPHGDIPVRVYTPEGRAPFPVLVFYHGGGWVLGTLDSHDAICRALARAVPMVVFAVDYRLAPEHKFPAAAEDAWAAARWVVEHAATIGGDAARVAAGGDSAGGNLSAVVCLMARDRGGPRLVHQLLVYPATDAHMDAPSIHENAEGYFLTRDGMVWFWNHYLNGPADRANPYASPLRAADLRGLPPATVITAEFDPLRDEGERYAARLRQAGVPVDMKRYDGMIHAFFGMAAVFPQAQEAVDQAVAGLRAAFRS